jgi:site-specific recombinase XerD
MARQRKRPELIHCKVSSIANPRAPWRVSWPVEGDGGKTTRTRKAFSSEDAAWDFATEKDIEVANHGRRYGDIPPEVRRAFDYFRDESAKLEADGATVPRFEELVTDALARIRTAHNAITENAVTVAEAVAAFTDYKKTRVKERQLADLKTRLKRFAETFGAHPVRSITTAEIESWLASLRSRKNPDKLPVPPLLGPLARNHYRANLHAFFAYGTAKARGWTERNPVADLEPETVETGEPQAYTPEDAGKLMQAALDHHPELVPVMSLGMFCGLRVSEAIEADLGKLPRDAGEFRTTGKTGPRMAPLTEAALAWITAQPRRKGRAWEKSPRLLVNAMQELFKTAGVEAIDNGARHSFISYRTAETRDVARVADECGNSVSTIKNHYRQLVTAEAATAFFAIRPEEAAANVTSIQTGRASA